MGVPEEILSPQDAVPQGRQERRPASSLPHVGEGPSPTAYAGRPPNPAPQAPPAPVRLSLDAIGQRDEVIRQRVNAMIDRLDDLRTLGDDFTAVLEPIIRVSDELPRATRRVAELEAGLAQERQAGLDTRAEIGDVTRRLSALTAELADATARAEKAESDLRVRDEALEEARILFRDKTLAVENLERQLFGETEQNNALTGECKALRLEAQAADAALSRSESELATARERFGIVDQDNLRLQTLSEEQSRQLADLAQRHADLEGTAEHERQRLRALELKLAEQIGAREQREAQHEVEGGALRAERAGLLMKLEAVTNRAGSTEQSLAGIRNQLHEKDAAQRLSERNFKEASIARATSERRLEALQAELGRRMERLLEVERLRADLNSRCDMLNKAVAAKDAVIEQANSRHAVLADRAEQQLAKYEALRIDLETANRRLSEDLEKERSERALLQGALDVARGSRIALQKQHEALKRSGRGWREMGGGEEGAESDQSDDASNVHPLAFPGRSV